MSYYHIHWKGAALIKIFASQFGLLFINIQYENLPQNYNETRMQTEP